MVCFTIDETFGKKRYQVSQFKLAPKALIMLLSSSTLSGSRRGKTSDSTGREMSSSVRSKRMYPKN